MYCTYCTPSSSSFSFCTTGAGACVSECIMGMGNVGFGSCCVDDDTLGTGELWEGWGVRGGIFGVGFTLLLLTVLRMMRG